MDCKVFIVIVLIYNELICTNAEWQTPFFEVTEDNRIELVELNDKEVILTFEENVKDIDFILGRLLLDDAAEPQMIPTTNTFFKISGFNFVSTTPLNYEAEDQKRLQYKILDITETRTITIQVKNLNDNPVYVEQSETCSLNELETPDKLNCDFTVLDQDGLMDQMDITKLSPYAENFEFYWRNGVPDPDITEAKIDIRTKLEFDYQDTKIVIFDWTVKDEKYSAITKVVVNINDIPNLPPLWETIINSAQFNEKEKQEFSIKAIDGDYGINDNIQYKWNIITPELKKYIHFQPDTNGNLAINVDGIDRDEFQIDVYKFQVIACETVMPQECIDKQIVFMVNDINDQVPEITISKEKLLIRENTYEKLDTQINIYDKDLGENAKYTVTLESAISNINDIFQIVPNSGYQQGDFSISVLTKEVLDFDRLPDMKKFKFDIVATETIPTNPHAPTRKTIEIELINWNDEIPVFSKQSYEIEIQETFGRLVEETLPIEDLYATDADIDDCVTYKLVGEAIKKILQFDVNVEKCEPGTPSTPINIKTKKAASNALQLFDFETQPEVIVQLEAQDNFKANTGVPHKIIAPIVIKLIDVNDETPVILNNQPVITIEEGQPDGTEIPDIDITASDDDEHAILKFGINWEKSYIAKNGKISRDWGTFENCIRIETHSIPNSRNKRAKLFIKETVDDNTPDFETFDTMYLYINVTDDGQEYGNPSSEVSLVISIENVNDVAPKFIVSTLSEKIVKDKAATDTLIGIITAEDEDEDVSDKIEYSIEERNATFPDLLKIDSVTGELFVKKNKGIDADVPTYYLYYNVYAFDGIHTTQEQFTVKIDDINDQFPEFMENLVDQEIPEASEIGRPVLNIIAEDKDRDEPHYIISYNIKGENVKEFFEVSERGEITVKSDKLDRDEGQESFDVTVELRDNKGNVDGESLLTTSNFKIIITDVNNKIPEVITKNLKTEESILQGRDIGEIRAQDKDDPTTDNAKIDFELLEVNTISGKEMDTNVLNLDEYDPETGIAILKANTQLRGYHGSYNIKIKVTDRATNKLTSTGNVILNVDKFNFEFPKFIFPKAGQTLYIKPNQELDKPLLMFNSKPLDSISATDQQGDKYNIDFAVTDENSIFKVDNIVGSLNSGTLKLTSREDISKKYEVHVIAQDDGKPSHNSTISFFVRFIDDTTKPAYVNPTFNIKFKEGEISLGNEFTTPEATLNLEGEIENLFPIYYKIFEDPNDAFSINSETGVLTLIKVLNIVDEPIPYVKIAASTYESGELNPEPQSILKVIIELIDVNDHTPQFSQEIYYGAIMSTYDLQRVIVSTNADDLDPDDVLTYSIIEDSIEVHGEEISLNNKFHLTKVNNKQCEIKLGFQVQTNMKGYFMFKMLVDDSLHTNTSLIKINIIEERNLVKFIFENTVNEVNDKQNIIVQVFTEYFELDCVIDSIVESTAETKISEEKTDVVVHFITKDNEPLDNNEIQIMMNDEDMNSNIRSALRSEGLFLYTIDNKVEIDDNSEEVLRAWLIGVTVVLGSICVLLIVAFILKTRSLNKRLNKLTVVECVSQEDLSKIAAAPTTNRRAIDGANPIYNINSDESKMPAYDRESVSSGESDLIGVENNPVFY